MTTQYNPSDIFQRLKHGGAVSREELEYVRRRLRDPEPGADLYSLILAFGRGHPPTSENVDLLERYLFQSNDSLYLSAVINVFSLYWNITGDYLDTLFSFVILEKWAAYPDAAIAAFGALGIYLQESRDARVYAKILELIDRDLRLHEQSDPAFEPRHLELAYKALDVGIRGWEIASADPRYRRFRGPGDVDLRILHAARQRAKQGGR